VSLSKQLLQAIEIIDKQDKIIAVLEEELKQLSRLDDAYISAVIHECLDDDGTFTVPEAMPEGKLSKEVQIKIDKIRKEDD